MSPVMYDLTLTLQTCTEETRARVRQIWSRAGRSVLNRTCEVLPEVSKPADDVLWCELAVLAAHRFAALGLTLA